MRNSYKFHFNSSIGWLTIEQRWEDERDRWEFRIWEGSFSYGMNNRLTYEDSLERLKQMVIGKTNHHPKPFLHYTGCSVYRSLPEPLKIDLT